MVIIDLHASQIDVKITEFTRPTCAFSLIDYCFIRQRMESLTDIRFNAESETTVL